MEELKTLNDIREMITVSAVNHNYPLDLAKEEAIKHIKKLFVCHDCKTGYNEYHKENCDEVRCKYCEKQALICNCTQKDKFHRKTGEKNKFGHDMDFRPTHTIDWIKHFFNIQENEL